MSIATVKAVINGQTYPLTLAEDGYYTLSGTAPALSSANEPGGYYGVQIIATDEAGNETTINQEAGTWGEQLRLVAYESVKPTATITYPSSDSRINTCTIAVTAPTISLSLPAEGLVTNQAAVQITGITSDDQLTSVTLTVTVNGHDQEPVTVDGQTGAFAVSANPSHMQEGSNVITVKVVDATGLEAEITRNVTLDTIPPRIVEVIGVTDRVHVGAPFTIRVKVED